MKTQDIIGSTVNYFVRRPEGAVKFPAIVVGAAASGNIDLAYINPDKKQYLLGAGWQEAFERVDDVPPFGSNGRHSFQLIRGK